MIRIATKTLRYLALCINFNMYQRTVLEVQLKSSRRSLLWGIRRASSTNSIETMVGSTLGKSCIAPHQCVEWPEPWAVALGSNGVWLTQLLVILQSSCQDSCWMVTLCCFRGFWYMWLIPCTFSSGRKNLLNLPKSPRNQVGVRLDFSWFTDLLWIPEILIIE